METRSQRSPAALAAIAAVVFLLSMFLDWYALDVPSRVGGREIDAPAFNAFEGLDRSDVVLVVAALLALLFTGLLLARILASSPMPGLGLLGAGILMLAVVLYRGTSRPTRPFFGGTRADTTLEIGWYIGLVAAGLIALGGVLAYLAGPRLALADEEFDDGVDEPSRPNSREGD